MSYILEALKKAQAERELGRVPPLQGTASALAREFGGAERSRLPRWAWPAALLALAGAGTAAWLVTRAPAPAAVVGATPAGAVTAAPTPAPTAPAAPPLLPVSAPPSPSRVLPPELPPAAASAPQPASPGAMPAAASPRVAAAADSGSTVAGLESLDAATRSRLPPLLAGGTIHSADRSQRMVILDGQVLREGDSLTPEVSVLAIEPQGVVLQLGAAFGHRRVRIKP